MAGSFTVRIADFGLAKNNRRTVTRGVGTPAYMVSLLLRWPRCYSSIAKYVSLTLRVKP